ncbi:ADP-forming succinate--CoA ligase subunit beta, partial [Candidatus Bathyarchaeota archaeon]|nr:ADP-forming succinate--CoA ligase subunit beta [Candidatus Bathyarchaeota archaeon]
MKLFEHEAKAIFSKHDIPTPLGKLADSPAKAREVTMQLHTPVAIKAQVTVAGRGKAGGILFANSPIEAEVAAKKMLGTRIKGTKVQSVLVEEKASVRKELYFGITIDRSTRSYVAVASSEGGMEIEEIAATMPEKIIKVFIDPLYGFRSHHARQIAKKLGYKGRQMLDLATIFRKQYEVALDYDAELAEMNPIAETSEGGFTAIDTRLIIDDNALYRHPQLKKRPTETEVDLTQQELEARENGLAYVSLDGNIGVVGNGAGLVMATLDVIELYGGTPANFLDVGGGATANRITAALKLVFSNPQVKAVFINILGGITRCDEVAKGILEAKRQTGLLKPIVIRL